MGIYKPLLTLTAYPWYAADFRLGLACSLLGFSAGFILGKRKGYNGWALGLLGAFFWAYTIVAIAFLPAKESLKKS